MDNSTNKNLLTVIIIAKDEEEKIPDCLRSISWASDILVIDTGSKDKTVEIAKRFGAKVIIYTNGSYSDWRNKGLEIAKGRWVFYIDADERVTPKLKDELIRTLKSDFENNRFDAYAIPRENIILGKLLKHGGWWPDYVKRLYLRSRLVRWKGDLHEEPLFEGKLGHFKNPLIHLKHDNLSDMVEKTNKWSEIEAKLMFNSNHPKMNQMRFLSAMFREFWLRMIREKAYLDGAEGIIYAFYQVYSRFISYAKLWEMQLNLNKTNHSK